MTDTRRNEPQPSPLPQTEEKQKAEAIVEAADYQPRGGDDLVPPDKKDRPADGELGAGD